MPTPRNIFKQRLGTSRQIGLWLGLASPYAAEICAGAGFDWLLVDGEHAPNDLADMLESLRAIKSMGANAVVRPPIGETWQIKRLLDIGAQTLLIPMVESAAQAQDLVRAVRYPPHGIRGVGAATARASDFGRITDYLATANDQVCLLLQLESRKGLSQLDAIAAVEGVDGVFIGPADLAADMGLLGQPTAPEVQSAVAAAISRLVELGKPAGILVADPALARKYLGLGASFVAVGTDVTLLARTTTALAGSFKDAGDVFSVKA